MWEVDPETRSKLLDIQKQNGNNLCVDCNAPSPQWASPKFGIFMCLNCSGVHRGLGVHISFVRSISMDAFKAAELVRMKHGGNAPWKAFFDAHETNQLVGRTFDDCTISDRYDSEVGEEWKERLTAKVEGREYVPGEEKKKKPAGAKKTVESTATSGGSRSETPLGRVRSADSPSASTGLGTASLNPQAASSRKAQNEAYFARMGSENASRPDHLPPSQGGKYAGFGSDPTAGTAGGQRKDGASGAPGMDDFQRDPVAALTKGFGWLSTAVGQGAKTGYEGWLKPSMQKLAETDLAHQLGQNIQSGTKTASETFTRFVEGPSASSSRIEGDGASRRGPDADKRDFWDTFGEAPKGPSVDKQDFWDEFAAAGSGGGGGGGGASAVKPKPTSIGTAAMRKGGGAGGGQGGNW